MKEDQGAAGQQPAHVEPREDANDQISVAELLREARSELFSLCEATTDECQDIAVRDTEGKPGAFARGRKSEAKGISRAMGEVFRELIARAEERS